MDFCHNILLYIVFAVQLVSHCLALDLVRTVSRTPQERRPLRKGYLNFSNNPNNKSNIYKTTSLTQRPYMKWEGGIKENNLRMVIVSRRNIKTNKTAKSTTAHQRNKRHSTFVSLYNKPTTPSYIEFYYLDETDSKDDIQNGSFNRHRFVTKKTGLDWFGNGETKSDKFKTRTTPPQSLFSFRLHGPYIRRVLIHPRIPVVKTFQKPLVYPRVETVNNSNTEKVIKHNHNERSAELINSRTETDQKPVTVKYYSNRFILLKTDTTREQETTFKLDFFSTKPPNRASTIPDDKVKFFEMYDNNTEQPLEEDGYITETNQIDSLSDDDYFHRRNSQEDKNNHVNRRHCDSKHKIKYEKKDANFSKLIAATNSKIENQIQISNNASNSVPALIENNSTYAPADKDAFTKAWNKIAKTGFITVKMANWSSCPFASVYVYKPTQTHCDAAAISPHWLVAAGSCMSHHRLIHTLDETSAFVTYCGHHWQQPERVAYVKSSVVHPKFSPRNGYRRLMYNIGLIQVSSSMASCPGWSAVSLVSRQFTAEPAGSMASAVGWGLDRYGSKYSSERLPQWPLTVYEALVFSDMCPGSTSYSVARHETSNVYCLLLPPYDGEDSDPVHGGLLLVGGKLVALYLQEERRSWGAQSAQYTGIWRLIPWVMATAREPHDEAFIQS